MLAIEQTYVSLLADVARLSGFSEIRGSYEGLQWCLNEAPKLEKLILGCIEQGSDPELDVFPVWLRRLAAASVKDAVQLRLLRQLLLFCYKASITHDKQTTDKAFQNFLDVNRDVANYGNWLSNANPVLCDAARKHCNSVLYRFDEGRLAPSHGPGSVTTSKLRWEHRFDTIEAVYPYSDWFYLYNNRSHLEEYDDLIHGAHITAKLIAVPKDARGPRLICVHPAESIWIQQGVRLELERSISLHRRQCGPWPQGHIHFDDQSVNGKIALLSSKSRKYATLDMKEASDRISEPLVQMLFGSKYKWFGACRAQKVIVPAHSGKVQMIEDIASYAPMGNATTFPVQSLVFWAICVAALQRLGFRQPGAVFVFGDDIICPTEAAPYIIDALESFGLVVNRTKSFWRGAFRESCGVDAFNGVNVTPVRWKTKADTRHLADLQSLSDIALRLRMAGYEEAAATAYGILRVQMRCRYGYGVRYTNNPDHGGIAEYTDRHSMVWRDAFWHQSYQMFASPVGRVEVVEPRLKDHGWNHVLDSVVSLERQNAGRARQLERVSRRVRLDRG